MEKAIKKAIEGGWDSCTCGFTINKLNGHASYCSMNQTSGWSTSIFLDPLFWQALGKAEGWGKTETTEIVNYGLPAEDFLVIDTWLYEWHNFIDHLAEGKDINSFFEELLK